jgi:hypothetical protein
MKVQEMVNEKISQEEHHIKYRVKPKEVPAHVNESRYEKITKDNLERRK